jgi:ParB family chromosome partitioning protein
MAIIENLQREDLNVVDRARAFKRLTDEFGLKHGEIGKKMGRSREYVANTVRVLNMPEEMIDALSEGKITEGHTRPLLMLTDRPEEQRTLFKEILAKKMTVREAEGISRRIAYERARRPDRMIDPDMIDLEDKLKVYLGTRVRIEKKEAGGRISIDFFSVDDLKGIMQKLENANSGVSNVGSNNPENQPVELETPIDDRSKEEKIAEENSDDLYSIKNFSV